MRKKIKFSKLILLINKIINLFYIKYNYLDGTYNFNMKYIISLLKKIYVHMLD